MAKAETTVETYLDGLDLDGLLALRDKIDELISAQADDRRRQLELELEKLASITGGRRTAIVPTEKRTRGPATAKYRSLSNPDLTWANRGQKPKWLLAEMEETGKPIEAFLIK